MESTGITLHLRRMFCSVAVADAASFSYPAARVGVSPQARSSQVRGLEAEVGQLLSFRTPAEAVQMDVEPAA
jgi:DNA-binding transcriptional LysR family regulator